MDLSKDKSPSPPGQAGGRTAQDWTIFALLTVLWASAYALTRIAVEKNDPESGLPVEWVLCGRLTIGGVFLWVLMVSQGKAFPPLRDFRRWRTIGAMALTGVVFPFFLITHAQQTVSSSLAALYASAAPIFVALGAASVFRDEYLTRSSILGVCIGFAGVAILIGPDALTGWGTAGLTAQILLIGGTFCYALSNLVARAAPKMDALVFATGFVLLGALLTWPMALMVDPAGVQADWAHWAAVAGMGLGASGIAQALYMFLIARTSATFLSLIGYTIPVVSAVFGWLLFGEVQRWNALLAFALILGGVWMARRGGGVKS